MVRTTVIDDVNGDANDFDNGEGMIIEEADPTTRASSSCSSSSTDDILSMFDEGDEDWADDLRIVAFAPGDMDMG